MRRSKFCNCQTSSNKEILKDTITHSFCDKCGCILLKEENENIYYTLKPKQIILPYDLDPITIIKNMKNKTEENYPFIYEEYNICKADKNTLEKTLDSINIYSKYRKKILIKLQKLIKFFDYYDKVFYQCLFFLDTYFSHHMKEEISEEEIFYYLIGFFLCSVKFKEIDINGPSLKVICDIQKGINLSSNKMTYYEVLCLKNINYNLFSYSAYDWIYQLISNGIIFNNEINENNEKILIRGHCHSIINVINKYIIKLFLNLTSKNIFFKYAPMYVAFSLIQIAREKFLDKSMIKENLFLRLIKLYGIKQDDYKKCYLEIKDEIYSEESDMSKIFGKKLNINIKNDNYTMEDLKTIEKSETNKIYSISRNNAYDPDRIKINNVLDNVKRNLLTYEDNSQKIILKDKQNSEEEKIIQFKLDKLKSKKKNKIKLKRNFFQINPFESLSINCNNNFFKSNDNLPYINSNSNERNSIFSLNSFSLEKFYSKNISLNKMRDKSINNELKPIIPNIKKCENIEFNNKTLRNIFSSSIEKEKHNENKKNKKNNFISLSDKKLDFGYKNLEIDLTRKNKLISGELPKIQSLKELIFPKKRKIIGLSKNIKKYSSKKHYKLKSNNNNFEIKLTFPKEEFKCFKESN